MDLPTFAYAHLPSRLFFDVRPDADGVLRVPPEKALLDTLYAQRGAIDWASIVAGALDRESLFSLAALYPRFVQSAIARSPLSP